MLPPSGLLPQRVQLWLRKRIRPALVVGLVALTVGQVIALFPSSVEEEETSNAPIDPESLMPDHSQILASGIPQNRIPEYQVARFDYVSTQAGEKQWNLIAEQAALYSKEKLVHAQTVKANLFDPDGRITLITGLEAKYFMNQRDLEVFGNVVAKFPDGFELYSDYLRYKPNERIIEIPSKYAVHGGSKVEGDQEMKFESMGFHYQMARSQILLPEAVRLTMRKPENPNDTTMIESDRCEIDRARKHADFTMGPWRKSSERYVHITQPTLFTRGRRARLNYGDNSAKLLRYLVAYDDVLVKQIDEKPKPGATPRPPALKYATAGQADFDSERSLIILTRFPQVYQDGDTVTGDLIKVHRDTDIVEVENSNSFSEGSSEP